MKKLLLSLLLAVQLSATGPSISAQQTVLNRRLWALQKRFGFQDLWIEVAVKKQGEMKAPGTWGDEWCDMNGCHIEVLDSNDYPKSMPAGLRAAHQQKVLIHEMLHILLTTGKVPDQVQDDLIDLIQPRMR